MRKIFTLLLILLFYPLSFWAQAVVYVGGVELTSSTSNPAYATTDDSGNVSTEGATADNYNIKWDGSTLTLRNATIKISNNHTNVGGAAIGVVNSSGEAALTIQLEGQKKHIIGDLHRDLCLFFWRNSQPDHHG